MTSPEKMSQKNTEQRHVPVMRDRCVELLAPALEQPGSIVVDTTLGMGGHSEALLQGCPQAREIGLTATFLGGDGWAGVKNYASAENLEGSYYCSAYASGTP